MNASQSQTFVGFIPGATGNTSASIRGGGLLVALSDIWVVAAIIVGLALRLFRLDDPPLWLDETTTAIWMRDSWGAMVRAILGDNHPPLYFLMLKAWTEVVGHSTVALRIPSALASVLCVPVIGAAAGLIAGRPALRWAAWLAAVAPMLVHHGQEARGYAVIALFAAVHFLIFVQFLHRRRQRLGWLYALSGALLAGSHYYGAAMVVAQAAVLVLIERRSWRLWLAPVAVACMVVAASGLAAALLAYHQAGGQYEFAGLAIAGVLWGLISEYTLLPTSEELHFIGVSAALRFAPVAVIGAACVAIAGIWGLRRLDLRMRVAVIVPLATVIFGPWLASIFLDVGVHPRYAMPALPPLIVTLTAIAGVQGYGQLPRQLLGAILVVMALGTARHVIDPAHGREDIASAGRWLDQHVPRHEQILVTSAEMGQLARFHWPERPVRIYPDRRARVTEANVARIADDMPVSFSGRVYYVIGRDWVSDPEGILTAELLRRYRVCGSATVRGIRILCLRSFDSNSELPLSAARSDHADWTCKLPQFQPSS